MPQIRLLILIGCALISEGRCETTRFGESAKAEADLRAKFYQWRERANKKLGNPPTSDVQFNCETRMIKMLTPQGYFTGMKRPVKTPKDNGFCMSVFIVDNIPIQGSKEEWLKENMLHWENDKPRHYFTGILLYKPFPEPSSSFRVDFSGFIGNNLTSETGNIMADLIEDLGSSIGAKGRWNSAFMDSLRNPKIRAESGPRD